MKLHNPETVDGTKVRIGRRVVHRKVDGQSVDVVTDIYAAIYKDTNGKRVNHSLKTTNRREARRKAIEIQSRLEKGKKRVVFKKITVKELLDQYEDYCKAKGLTPKSLAKYHADLEKLREYCQCKRIKMAQDFGEDEYHHFRGWLEGRIHKQGVAYAPKTVSGVLLVTKQAFKWGWKRKLLPHHNLIGVALPKAKARPQPCFTTEQVEKLLSLTKGRERSALAVLAYAGLRIGELEKLQWQDVLFDRGELGMLHIQRGGSGDAPKDKDHRFIPIHPRIRELLEPQKRREGPVFPDAKERRLLARLKQLCQHAGFTSPNQYKLHSFRHHFASMCANHQVAERKALAWMGHSSSNILSLYYHLTDAESEAAMKALAESLWNFGSFIK